MKEGLKKRCCDVSSKPAVGRTHLDLTLLNFLALAEMVRTYARQLKITTGLTQNASHLQKVTEAFSRNVDGFFLSLT